jgi:hypothetical protein
MEWIAASGVLRRQLSRNQGVGFFEKLAPCLIGMEACASAHYWARVFQRMGHTVRLIAPQFVKPYVKDGSLESETFTFMKDGNDEENEMPPPPSLVLPSSPRPFPCFSLHPSRSSWLIFLHRFS